MHKKEKILVIITSILCVLAFAGIGGYFLFFAQKPQEKKVADVVQKISLDPKAEATHISKVAGEKGAYWMRGFDIVWNSIEHEKGTYDWQPLDEQMSFQAGEGETYYLSIIWPYANWDQKKCHSGEKYIATGHLHSRDGEDLMMGAPCDMAAYSEFIKKVVERYDGDGTDDMPGLKTPVKYWEVLNEPEMQGGKPGGAGEDLKFFVGSSGEYLEILKNSYGAIKSADPGAKVLHAGMAGMQEEFQKFWDPVFAGGAGQYFDIANIHTISTDERREDLYMIKFKRYLEKYGIKDKPIWITEVQFGDLMGKPADVPSFDNLMAKSSIFALALGADKLFLIENWTQWDNPDAYKPPEEEGKDKEKEGKKPPKPKIDLSNNSTHKVYLNLVDKLGNFEKVEALQEKYDENPMEQDGAVSSVGHYKFTNGAKVVYVLWGAGSAVELEITGKLKVTDIYGSAKEIDASQLTLTDSPFFVELLK
ncbi:hypothetical protein C4544_05795 [candidate division WS5 bacterium]|uniref:Asl1-like glycosyl hydrolase catalytic domain-containing protein n=1 Tax=candidate division WS5 bacterium TaxID=2093353 RepID=A0A419DAZ0_9BACT|nr:MAG: hypothetical protein C4544_05795 [candidate division WS5 bacterium]